MAELIQVRASDALLVIDMQNDFLPAEVGYTGALGVAGGDTIVHEIEALARRFDHVVLTQDWHPQGHVSFASAHAGKRPFVDTVETSYGTQTLWPDHCVQGSPGAELAVDVPHAELILRKGFRREIDSYSAFLENDHATPTGLAGYLRERGLTRLFLCGLAYDFCVGFSAIDGSRLGFECLVIEDLSRAVALEGTVERTNACFTDARVRRVAAEQIVAR
jgi:nicotinamidase/pyrazinamidase